MIKEMEVFQFNNVPFPFYSPHYFFHLIFHNLSLYMSISNLILLCNMDMCLFMFMYMARGKEQGKKEDNL